METKTQLLKTIKEAKKTIALAEDDLWILFKEEITKFFTDNPTVKEVKVGVNNHEFNDGDTTQYYLYYDDGVLLVDEKYEVYGWSADHELKEFPNGKAISEKFREILSEFDIDSLYEDKIGGYEQLTFELVGGKLKIS